MQHHMRYRVLRDCHLPPDMGDRGSHLKPAPIGHLNKAAQALPPCLLYCSAGLMWLPQVSPSVLTGLHTLRALLYLLLSKSHALMS